MGKLDTMLHCHTMSGTIYLIMSEALIHSQTVFINNFGLFTFYVPQNPIVKSKIVLQKPHEIGPLMNPYHQSSSQSTLYPICQNNTEVSTCLRYIHTFFGVAILVTSNTLNRDTRWEDLEEEK